MLFITACDVKYENGKVYINRSTIDKPTNETKLDKNYPTTELFFVNEEDSSYALTMPIDIITQAPPAKPMAAKPMRVRRTQSQRVVKKPTAMRRKIL